MLEKRNSRHDRLYRTSLAAFQSGPGISPEEQIVLIDNPDIFSSYEPVWDPWHKPNRGSGRLSQLKSFLRGRTAGRSVRLPKTSRLFLGYFNKSFDDPYEALSELFELMEGVPGREFRLVLGKGDYQIDSDLVRSLPANLTSLVANGINVEDRRVGYLPMGRDFRNLGLLNDFPPSADKSILCYCNFSLNTHPVRETLFSQIRQLLLLTTDHMGDFLSYSISRREFLVRLGLSKFCICPRGNAIDTFRLWDCLYLGTIPIVVKEAAFHDRLSDLPILFLEDYSSFSDLTEDYLEEKYEEFLGTVFNYSKLLKSHWLNGQGAL